MVRIQQRHIPMLQPHRRRLSRSNTRRCTGEKHAARLERVALADVGDGFGEGEDPGGGVAGLEVAVGLVFEAGGQGDVGGVEEGAGGDDAGAERAEGVEGFGVGPLGGEGLVVSRG